VIALFLSFVYGIAALFFGLAGTALTSDERLPLIWFMVLFPCLVLGVFGWLVAKHHHKLYAPTDFQNSDGFFRAISPDEFKAKLQADAESVQDESDSHLPESQSNPLEGDVRKAPLTAQILVAETLAVKAIEAEFGRPIIRNQHIQHRSLRHDGVFHLPDRQVVVEVKFTRSRSWAREIASAISYAEEIQKGKQVAIPVTVLLAIVADGITPVEFNSARDEAVQLLATASPLVKLRTYQFHDLLWGFGVSRE
jgi:hypothetical protein